MEEKDKKRVTVIDLLKAYPDGLSIQDIVDKTCLAISTLFSNVNVYSLV